MKALCGKEALVKLLRWHFGEASVLFSQFLSDRIIPALVNALHKEPDTEICASMLDSLNECLQISGMLLDERQVRSIVDEMKQVITASSSRKRERAERTKAEDFDAEESELIKEENEQEEEVFDQVGEILGTLIKTFKASFLTFFNELSSYLTPILRLLLHHQSAVDADQLEGSVTSLSNLDDSDSSKYLVRKKIIYACMQFFISVLQCSIVPFTVLLLSCYYSFPIDFKKSKFYGFDKKGNRWKERTAGTVKFPKNKVAYSLILQFDLAMALLFVIGYVGIIFEESLAFNKSGVGLLMAAPSIGVAVSELRLASAEVSEIVFFLLGAMTIVEIVDAHQGFKLVTDSITTRKPRILLWVILGLLSFSSLVHIYSWTTFAGTFGYAAP
ncbi:hypothetical protein S83_063193, partial [Arachis hypogaea]